MLFVLMELPRVIVMEFSIHKLRVKGKYETSKFLDLRVRRDVDEICAVLGYHAASNGNPLPTFQDNVSVPSSRVKRSKM
jgi:hypothetical protein